MPDDAGCIFCRILAGQAPASLVYQDDHVAAFMDIRPVVEGHLLVVPKTHAACLAELDDAEGARMFAVGKRMAQALRRSGLRCEGVNLYLADGKAAGQTVFHMHLHVLPRYIGDGLRLRSGFSLRPPPPRGKLEALAVRLRGELQGMAEGA